MWQSAEFTLEIKFKNASAFLPHHFAKGCDPMKSVLILGLGRFGRHTARKLSEMRLEVMGVDSDERMVDEVLPYVTDAKIGDSTDELFLRSLGVGNFDLCIVAIGDNFQSSLETTTLLKELGAMYVVSVASSDRHAEFLRRNGADDVIYPEKQLGEWAAIRYGSNHLADYFELDKEYAFFEIDMPRIWNGRKVGEINIRRNYNISLIGIKYRGRMDVAVTADTVLRTGTTLLVLGRHRDVLKCFHI